ncbi:translation initiation factor eIF-2B epsilon subunit, GEF [Knufia obscura]|uniref:Translation initiation factor eIF2B subunit epsilon n=2 Tax=Knufia TaxID=430999 RepID=A0AAN8EDI9_9EURO|nr:translation initiation factor eIF-2B epsilon subunit, GEF [Knufia obscura]KAK5952908.1 translation initiation factor eIF-2B epsilon subunit, GEF [Knufia fluminis]
MPPKQAKSAGRGKGEEAKEDPLQAVVVADTFENKFTPFSFERPRCLIPLANTPLIEYTFEYLASAGVQIIYFYAGAHIEQVEAYLKASKWMNSSSPFIRVELIRCMATSVGDIMRDLDQKQLINGDFICVSGDVVSDFPISKALKVHKQRREKDKNAIMTMVLRERNDSDHRHRSQTIPTFVIDPTKDRCLHYEESLAGAPFGTHIDPEMLKSAELDIRQDLIDCRIDICTPDVLSLWSDNFDNNHPRKEFLFGVLKDYELNGKTIHTYLVDGYYANRAESPTAYATITYDLQHGVASSLALTNNVSGTRFKRLRNDISQEDGVIIQRPARLAHGTIVGEGSSIGAGTNLRRTVMGRRCQIGKKTKINSAFIWDDVTIGSNVKVTRAIIGSEAYIGDNVSIEEGALISFAANIPPGTHVAAGKRVTAQSKFDQDGMQPAEDGYDSDVEEQEEDSGWAQSFYQKAEFNDSNSSLASDASETSGQISADGSRSQSFATHASDDDGTERFVHDTAAILVQRMQEGHHADDMQSELMGLRFSGGADGSMVQKAVAIALTKHIHAEVTGGVSAQEATRKTLEQYRFLIRRQNAEQTTEEQVVFLLEAQTDLAKRSDGSKVMPFFVKDLYDLDVFEEDAFTEWYEDERSQEAAVTATRDAAKPFIDWLAEADEEESEDDEEEEDDSED